jgi:hypothetical protein
MNQKILMNTNFLRKNKKEKKTKPPRSCHIPLAQTGNVAGCRSSDVFHEASWQ